MWVSLSIFALLQAVLCADYQFIPLKKLCKSVRRGQMDDPDVKPSYISQLISEFEPYAAKFDALADKRAIFRKKLQAISTDVWYLRHDMVEVDFQTLDGICALDCLKCEHDNLDMEYDDLVEECIEEFDADLHTIREYYGGAKIDCENLQFSPNTIKGQMNKRLIPVAASRFQLAHFLFVTFKRKQARGYPLKS